MSHLAAVRAALSHVPIQSRPVLAAQILGEELARLALLRQLAPETRRAVQAHLWQAAETLEDAVAQSLVPRPGEEVVLQMPGGGQVTGTVARVSGPHLWLEGDRVPWPAAAVIRNLALRPHRPLASDCTQPDGVA